MSDDGLYGARGAGAEGGSIHDRWIVFVRADDRSGTLTALADMFSSRGVSFESFNTLSIADGAGVMSIVFRGSARLARVLARTLERLAVTRDVTLVPATDPDVRAVAVLRGGIADDARLTLTRCPDGTTIVAGVLADVEARIRQEAAVRVDALTVLPPRR